MTEHTLEQLQEQHAEMLATAHDIGLETPEDLKPELSDVAVGRTIVSNLDTLIRNHLATVETVGDNAPVGAEQEQENEVTAVSTETNTKAPKAKKVTTAKKVAVAKKVTAPKKVAAAKKAIAAAKAPKPVKKAAAPKRIAFAPDAVITWGSKANPAREASGKYKRIENVKAYSGKTVKAYLGGKISQAKSLKWCVDQGLCKVA